jgi:hypothetical protein
MNHGHAKAHRKFVDSPGGHACLGMADRMANCVVGVFVNVFGGKWDLPSRTWTVRLRHGWIVVVLAI